MNMDCPPKNSPTYVASMCSERLKIKITSASSIEYMVVFLMITVMSNRRSFMMAIPIKAPKAALTSPRTGDASRVVSKLVGRRDTVRKLREITRKLIKMYCMWCRARGDVSRRRARNSNQHADQIKAREMTRKIEKKIRCLASAWNSK